MVPPSTMSFYINFTSTDNFKVEKANYEDNKYIRKISIVNQFKILTILLMPTASSLNQTEIFDIFLQVNSPERFETNNEYNIKLIVHINSPNATHSSIQKISPISKGLNSTENSTVAYPTTTSLTKLKNFEIGDQLEPTHMFLNDHTSFQVTIHLMLFLIIFS